MNEFATSSTPPRGGMKFRTILILLLVAFALGVAGSWWLADRYGWFEAETPVAAAPAPAANALAPAVTPAPLLVPSSVDSAIAAGNTARAEGLLVAFAARRALDSGAPLGYLSDQLRLRFGTSQPQAVLAVLQASATPVTLQALQSELTGIETLLMTGNPDANLWTTLQREMSELFVLRKSDSASPAPSQRMLRAHTLVETGNIGRAIAEIEAMPGASAAAAQNWLARARGYDAARKALDTLERSALAAPPIPVAPVAPVMPAPEPATPAVAVPE
jgi:hypothetical protein